VGRVGRTSGRSNLGRLAEGELAAFSKHSFVVATLLLYNNKDILFLEIEKKCVFEKRRENKQFLPKQSAPQFKILSALFLYSKFKKKWEQSLLVAMKKRR